MKTKKQNGVNEDDLFNDDENVIEGEDVEETSEDEEGSTEDDQTSEEGEGSEDEDGEPKREARQHKGFNKRINELTKKRRDAERERDAERARAAELERRLKEVESYQSEAEVHAIEAKMESMKQRLLAARAADDLDEEIKIQQEIAEASQRKMVHLARKTVNEQERKELEQKPAQQTQKRILPEVEMLIEANPWLLAPASPEEQQAALIARRLANKLESEGLDPFTDPEYAEQMEVLLDEELSKRGLNVLQSPYTTQNRSAATKGNTQQSQATSAKAGGAQRGGLSSSSSVKSAKGPSFKLTSAQKELAKLAGMSEAKYAEYLSAAKE